MGSIQAGMTGHRHSQGLAMPSMHCVCITQVLAGRPDQPLFFHSCSCRERHISFPVGDFGSSVTNSTSSGTL